VDKPADRQIPSKIESVDSKDGSSQQTEEQEGMFKDVLFDYDKYEVKETYQPAMKSLASWMTKNNGARLSVEGHCDERGTNEYNLALGDRRAKAVRDALVALGVPTSKIDIISYGEEKPLCKEQSEECWAKNRRAHFVVLTKAGKK
jgi:peptidoglycan-associated lipoprotein